MMKIIVGLVCFLSFKAYAFESMLQFENDRVCVLRATISPYEELDLHRDDYPQVVVALHGGALVRLETDGRVVDVPFPTGMAVFREADPEGEFHRSVNPSSYPLELMIIQLKK